MQVLVFGRKYKEKDKAIIQETLDALVAEGINIYIYGPYLDTIKEHVKLPKNYGVFDSHMDFKIHRIDVVVVLGGDGTMLSAVCLVRDSGVPLMGINLGRMGFLADIHKEQVRQSISMIRHGRYSIDERTTLYLEANPNIFGDMPFALNDCTLLKRDTSSMITVHTFINGDYINSYWADGLIISTPTGSTGYSLSCGGPIIFPDSGNFVITPVAPHNLNVRPIVISDESIISFEIEGRGENFICTLDSRFEIIRNDYQLAVRKNDFTIRLVRLEDVSFLQTIREKLTWGKDIRN